MRHSVSKPEDHHRQLGVYDQGGALVLILRRMEARMHAQIVNVQSASEKCAVRMQEFEKMIDSKKEVINETVPHLGSKAEHVFSTPIAMHHRHDLNVN